MNGSTRASTTLSTSRNGGISQAAQAVVMSLLAAVFAACLSASIARAQGMRADYQRAATLEQRTANRVFRLRVEPQWNTAGTAFWYRIETGPDTHEFLWVDAERGERKAAFDHGKLAAALQAAVRPELAPPIAATRLPLERLEFSADQQRLRFRAFETDWEWRLADHTLRRLDPADQEAARPDAPANPPDRRGAADRLEASGPALAPQETWQRSMDGGEETTVLFVNATVNEIELWWVPAEGPERSYGRLAAGAKRQQHTFAGHAWRIADPKGENRALFVASATPSVARIDARTKAPRAPTPAASPDAVDRKTKGNGDSRRVDNDKTRVASSRSANRQNPGRQNPGRENPGRGPRSQSPDGRWTLEVVDFNLQLVERRKDKSAGNSLPAGPDKPASPDTPAGPDSGEDVEQAADGDVLTSDGTVEDAYGGPFLWSPDGRFVVAWQTLAAPEREVHLIESSPRDQLQPKLHTFPYAKPGDPLPQRRPRIVSLVERRVVPLASELEEILAAPTWSLDGPRWRPDSSGFTFTHHQRGHQLTRVFSLTPTTGAFRVVIEERSPTFFDYAHKQFLHWLDQTGEALWMSERDGHNHLYLYDTANGSVKHQITRGDWVVRGVERVDEEKRQLWLRVSGMDPQQDPYQLHLIRIGLDGSGLTRLTRSDGSHRWRFSPDGRFLLATWSRVDQPPVVELRRSDTGELVCEVERADVSRLIETGWRAPERFVAKGRDGRTDIHGVVIRPANFDPARRWPVVEQIYAGPQSAYVPKEWGSQGGPRQIAELGFVVVMIDGMGTSQRSKAFHDVCHKNLGDAGFPDRIAWIRALGAQYPELDLSRVGLYGGSAGGQNAVRGLIAHGDFYRVAVADCGCHDNRMDKVWWNELWMGWPVGPHFEEQSNAAQAHRLSGRLLLIVGELDRNVDPASTMQVVDALVRADKDFDLLVIPGAGHGAAETPYGRRRRADFLVRHLLGVEPRRE